MGHSCQLTQSAMRFYRPRTLLQDSRRDLHARCIEMEYKYHRQLDFEGELTFIA